MLLGSQVLLLGQETGIQQKNFKASGTRKRAPLYLKGTEIKREGPQQTILKRGGREINNLDMNT